MNIHMYIHIYINECGTTEFWIYSRINKIENNKIYLVKLEFHMKL
jgi:predicted nucleic-acid-binding Zn-ribbon protein